MTEHAPSHMKLRAARPEDSRKIWEWRNEQSAREASFNTSVIPYADHERWFSQRLNDPKSRMFIVVNSSGRDVGYVRFDIVRDSAEISMSIDKDERLRGIGAQAIQTASNHLLVTESLREIMARIKCNNAASMAAFKRAGFVFRNRSQYAGIDVSEMIYRRKPDAHSKR